MIDLDARSKLAEAMDDPALEPKVLRQVFADLNRTNWLLGGQLISLRAIDSLLKALPTGRRTVIDMGCGDGDLLRRLARKYRKKGKEVHLVGIDNNERALAIARERSAGFPEIQFQLASLLDMDHLTMSCDILHCALTLHHFENKDIPGMLRHFTRISRHGVVINDLQRNKWAYYLFHGFSRIFIKTKIAKQDGLISICRGFRKKELMELSSGLPGYRHRIRLCWIFRYLWVIQVKGPAAHE